MASELLGVYFTLPAGLRSRHLQTFARVTILQSSSLDTTRAVLVTVTDIYINEMIQSWLKFELLSLDVGGPIDEFRSVKSSGALNNIINADAGALADYGGASYACLSYAGAPTMAPLRFFAYLYFVML